MWKFFWIVILTCLALPVSAHVLKKDDTIGAIIHIDPEDNPRVGQPATFFLSFKDTANQFRLSACDCQAQILQNEKIIATITVTEGATAQTGTFGYAFPRQGTYDVHVFGHPKASGTFDDFILHYDLRVDRTAAAGQKNSAIFHVIHYGVILGAMVIAGLVALGRKLKKT